MTGKWAIYFMLTGMCDLCVQKVQKDTKKETVSVRPKVTR